MNEAMFPNVQQWINVTNAQNNGIMLCALFALIPLVWLPAVKAYWPNRLALARWGFVTLYFITAIGLILVMGL